MSRLLFFVSSMQGGGAERVAALLCNYWVAEGHDVMLVPTFSGRGTCLYELDSRVRLNYLADTVGKRGSSPIGKLIRLSAIRKMIRRQAPDVVLSFLTNVNVAVLLASWRLEVPVIVAERSYPGAMPVGTVLARLRGLTYPRARAVVMQTAQGKEWLSKHVPQARGVVIANPCQYPLPTSVPVVDVNEKLRQGRRVLLSVGRLSGEKGYAILIAAFAALSKSFNDWDLVILGEGEERPALEEQVRHLRLCDRVRLFGRVGNLHDWYRRADLYVMSSLFEGFPNALLEAMSYGLPSVSFDCETGPADLIRHGENGLLVSPEHGAGGLRAALQCLMANSGMRQSMSGAARDVRDRYHVAMIGQLWSSVLNLNRSANTEG